VKARFWGTRGSLATPGPSTLRYGGNTSCVELCTQSGTRIIFDCGTGARLLGLSLLRSMPTGVAASILLGHTHWDHIQGFPFFGPVFDPTSRIAIYAPAGGDTQLAGVLAGQMEYTYFPIELEQLQASITFHNLGEDTFTVGDATVTTQYLNHTALTLGYRVTAGGVTVVYATDHEPHNSTLAHTDDSAGTRSIIHQGDQRHIDLLAGADLVIHDAQYTEQEYAAKAGWGHSPMEYAVDVAIEGGVKRLALFHHDPSRGDRDLDRLLARCQRRAEASAADLAVFGAREGRSVRLRERDCGGEDATEPVEPAVGEHLRVLIAHGDRDTRTLLADALGEDNYEFVLARDDGEALTLARDRPPDLVLLDADSGALAGREVCRALRAEPNTRDVPVVLLTADGSDTGIMEGFEDGATDYLTEPFVPAIVRTRVRSWLLRGGREEFE
jgi:phosphoribosyl 1,2-cyclic phosphodiesterase/CheY-like chemotaxis protein